MASTGWARMSNVVHTLPSTWQVRFNPVLTGEPASTGFINRSHRNPERTPVIMDGTIERALASCLADALASGADHRTRTAAAKRSILWNRGLNAAAKEMIDVILSGRPPPDSDEDSPTHRPTPSRGRRARGGRASGGQPLKFITRVSAEDASLPPAFRMASLLLRTAWQCGQDDDAMSLVTLRSSCDVGINPVWHALADLCDVLKPMKAHLTESPRSIAVICESLYGLVHGARRGS